MPNKIANNLSQEQLDAFNERCRQTRGLTLEKIRDLAGEMGIEISLMSAKSYKDVTFAEFLEDIKRKREAAEVIAEAAKDGATSTQAALSLGVQSILDKLIKREYLAPDELAGFIFALSRVKTGKEAEGLLAARLKESDAKLKDAERKEADWNREREAEAARKVAASAVMDRLEKKGGLSKEGREALNIELYGRGPK